MYRTVTAIVIATLLTASSGFALELRASVEPPIVGCSLVVVDPEYVPPPEGADPCIAAAIPPDATRLLWIATELWEQPPRPWPPGVEPTRLTCGAVRDGGRWSFSCFNAGVLGEYEYQGQRLAGVFTGTAAQLDTLVRSWWMAQR